LEKMQGITVDELRNKIAEALASHVKSYNLPTICERLGLASGDDSEAFRGKWRYVKKRLNGFTQPELLRIASEVDSEFGDIGLADLVSEMTLHADHRITEITRRNVLKKLNGLDPLFGDIDLFDGLKIIAFEQLSDVEFDFDYDFQNPLIEEIRQHYIRNGDLSNEELLIKCGALTCSQTRFIALLEKLLNPVVRQGDEQTILASEINSVLKADGFFAEAVDEISGHPIYAVHRIGAGVSGTPKNLIFASINTKPDLYFTDAISNDIAIRNKTDALIYDQFLSDSGLLWTTLAEWWQEREGLASLKESKTALCKRLRQSVRNACSPGETALFETYYRVFSKVLSDRLPALVPQVYLHYDFRTRKERGRDPALLRQRMDLLLLLDHNVRIVIEVDGKQHYADGEKASPTKYGEMAAEDRRLRLAGYELYRFGGAEFQDVVMSNNKCVIGPKAEQIAISFFRELFERHSIPMVQQPNE
jgi:hypothetical protein